MRSMTRMLPRPVLGLVLAGLGLLLTGCAPLVMPGPVHYPRNVVRLLDGHSGEEIPEALVLRLRSTSAGVITGDTLRGPRVGYFAAVSVLRTGETFSVAMPGTVAVVVLPAGVGAGSGDDFEEAIVIAPGYRSARYHGPRRITEPGTRRSWRDVVVLEPAEDPVAELQHVRGMLDKLMLTHEDIRDWPALRESVLHLHPPIYVRLAPLHRRLARDYLDEAIARIEREASALADGSALAR